MAVRTRWLVLLGLAAWCGPALAQESPKAGAGGSAPVEGGRVQLSDAEWRKRLTPEQYWVTRQKGTEEPWTGRYSRGRHKGIFACVGCGAELFSSAHKFESGTGWPSFWRPIREDALASAPDNSTAEFRVEVLCARCDAHLGHVFDDGPAPTGLRFCINSVALKLQPFEAAKATTAPKAPARGRPGAARSKDAAGDGTPRRDTQPPVPRTNKQPKTKKTADDE